MDVGRCPCTHAAIHRSIPRSKDGRTTVLVQRFVAGLRKAETRPETQAGAFSAGPKAVANFSTSTAATCLRVRLA